MLHTKAPFVQQLFQDYEIEIVFWNSLQLQWVIFVILMSSDIDQWPGNFVLSQALKHFFLEQKAGEPHRDLIWSAYILCSKI